MIPLMRKTHRYPIRPKMIDATRHFYDAFGNTETEVSAGWIVRFCQRVNSWEPFKLSALEAFYARKWKDGFTFNRLTGGYDDYVTVDRENDLVTLSHEFVVKCYQSSPVLWTKRKSPGNPYK